jgi:hypothetical protein
MKREFVYVICALGCFGGAVLASHSGEWRAFALGFLGAAGWLLAMAEVKP